MAAGMLMPMVRFAIDPVLQKEGWWGFCINEQKMADITDEPIKVDFYI